MRLISSLIVAMSFFLVALAKGDDGDETLKLFLSQSNLVVMLAHQTGIMLGIASETGTAICWMSVPVAE